MRNATNGRMQQSVVKHPARGKVRMVPKGATVLLRLDDKCDFGVPMGRSAAVHEASAAGGVDMLRLACNTAALRRLSATHRREWTGATHGPERDLGYVA